jgi:CheY-like chemotaxis protein
MQKMSTHAITREPPLRVFLAENGRDVRRMLATSLRLDGHFVLEAQTGAGLLLDLAHVFGPSGNATSASVVVTAARMPGQDGLSVFRMLREKPWCPPFIFVSAASDRTFREEALRLGAHAVFERPFDLLVLRDAINRLRHAPPPLIAAAVGA